MKMVKLGSVCEILNGFAFKSENYVDNGIRIIRIANVQKGFIEDNTPQFYPADTLPEISKYSLLDGDLLLSLTGNVGRVALLDQAFLPAALNQRVACLRINNETILNKRYLFNYLNSDFFEKNCIFSAQGIAQKNMSTEWLKEYKIHLPSIIEQKQIAAVLDKVTSLIAQRKQQLAQLDLLVKSRFVEMFGDLESNPRGWRLKRLDEISTTRLGKMLDAKNQIGNNAYEYLANFNVQWFRFDLKKLNAMDFDEADRKEFSLKNGDLLICEGGEIGRTAIWHEELKNCFFQKALHRVRCNTGVCVPEFIAWVMYFKTASNQFDGIATAATIAHLPGIKLKALLFPLPPFDLQNAFAAFVQQADKSKFEIQKGLKQMEIQYNALMQQYFG